MNDWIEGVLDQYGAWGVAAMMLLENILPPIPSEIVMPWAGYSASQGDNSFLAVVAAGSAGSFLGAFFWYEIAKWIGPDRLSKWVDRHGWWLTIDGRDVKRADKWFDRWGSFTVLICRCIPGLRTLVSIPAGFSEMPVFKFSLFTLIGTVIWTTGLAAIGWWLGKNYADFAGPLGWVSTAVVVAMFLWWLYRLVTHSMKRKASAK